MRRHPPSARVWLQSGRPVSLGKEGKQVVTVYKMMATTLQLLYCNVRISLVGLRLSSHTRSTKQPA